jgi:glucosamine--fructose-6-phosphate aminotransferase (isomerizing)
MCGIFGYVTGEEKNLGPILIEAGRSLSYRGYDSVGCATLHKDASVDLRKDAGKVDDVSGRLNFSEMTGSRGILQLRWATFGRPSQVNAQPHLDSDGDLVGAHNGNIVNNVQLREEFAAEGMTVRSMNDGESCVHAVERYIDRGMGFVDAIRCAYQDLAGDYAFVIGRTGEDTLYAIKKGSGLVAGVGAGFTCVSSDLPSVLPLTRDIIRVQDGEILALHPDRIDVYRVDDGKQVERPTERITETMETAKKGGYPHFMLKEIHEQSTVVRELIEVLDRSAEIDAMLEKIRQARHIYLVGCGTSYHACLLGAVYFAQLAGTSAIPVIAPQFMAQYGPTVTAQDVGIFVSQSGETKDVLNAIESVKHSGMTIYGIVNVIGSTLTRLSEHHLPLVCGYEISVPATKTYTNQVVSFLYLALRLANRPLDELKDLPRLIDATLEMVAPAIQAITPELAAWDDLYSLGYGYTYAVALEGALKLKEITYAHCEGMLSTEFKHGPLSAVREGFPVIFTGSSQDVPLLVSGINEVTCRGGRAIAIGEDDTRLRSNADDMIVLPPAPAHISAVLAALPLQLLSYHISLARGYDPDFPRNLSKTLTVD